MITILVLIFFIISSNREYYYNKLCALSSVDGDSTNSNIGRL